MTHTAGGGGGDGFGCGKKCLQGGLRACAAGRWEQDDSTKAVGIQGRWPKRMGKRKQKRWVPFSYFLECVINTTNMGYYAIEGALCMVALTVPGQWHLVPRQVSLWNCRRGTTLGWVFPCP